MDKKIIVFWGHQSRKCKQPQNSSCEHPTKRGSVLQAERMQMKVFSYLQLTTTQKSALAEKWRGWHRRRCALDLQLARAISSFDASLPSLIPQQFLDFLDTFLRQTAPKQSTSKLPNEAQTTHNPASGSATDAGTRLATDQAPDAGLGVTVGELHGVGVLHNEVPGVGVGVGVLHVGVGGVLQNDEARQNHEGDRDEDRGGKQQPRTEFMAAKSTALHDLECSRPGALLLFLLMFFSVSVMGPCGVHSVDTTTCACVEVSSG